MRDEPAKGKRDLGSCYPPGGKVVGPWRSQPARDCPAGRRQSQYGSPRCRRHGHVGRPAGSGKPSPRLDGDRQAVSVSWMWRTLDARAVCEVPHRRRADRREAAASYF